MHENASPFVSKADNSRLRGRRNQIQQELVTAPKAKLSFDLHSCSAVNRAYKNVNDVLTIDVGLGPKAQSRPTVLLNTLANEASVYDGTQAGWRGWLISARATATTATIASTLIERQNGARTVRVSAHAHIAVLRRICIGQTAYPVNISSCHIRPDDWPGFSGRPP